MLQYYNYYRICVLGLIMPVYALRADARHILHILTSIYPRTVFRISPQTTTENRGLNNNNKNLYASIPESFMGDFEEPRIVGTTQQSKPRA